MKHGKLVGLTASAVDFVCFQGTSTASPHTASVAALIISQYGRVGNDAGTPDVVMRPPEVGSYLRSTRIDLVSPIPGDKASTATTDASATAASTRSRAVEHDTSVVREPVETPVVSGCPTFR